MSKCALTMLSAVSIFTMIANNYDFDWKAMVKRILPIEWREMGEEKFVEMGKGKIFKTNFDK